MVLLVFLLLHHHPHPQTSTILLALVVALLPKADIKPPPHGTGMVLPNKLVVVVQEVMEVIPLLPVLLYPLSIL
jgi:hypothetical protein